MKRYILLTASALSLSLLITQTGVAFADDSDRLEKLEQEIQLLKRQQEVRDEIAKTQAEKTAPATVTFDKKGLAFTSYDKNLTLKLRGYFQIDSRTFINDDDKTGKNDIVARRLRPILEGTVGQNTSFRLMPDFSGSSARVFDAHVDYKYSNPLQFRIGKFKPPIGLERLQSAADTFFIERGHPTNLVPSRDFGVQAYGELIPQTLEYQLGVFNGTADLGNSDGDDDDNKDIAARIFATPFRNSDVVALQGFGIGIGGSVGDRAGSASKTILGDYRTPGQQSFFKYRTGTAAADTTYANGTQWRLYPQAYYYYNNLGVIGEYAVSSQDVTRGTNAATLQNKAWQLSAAYMLTGEDINFKDGVKPYANFDPANGTWGAWEVDARVGETDIDDKAFPLFADATKSASKATSQGVGLGWYWNENAKLMVDYDHTSFKGGATGKDREDEHAVLTRVQYRF